MLGHFTASMNDCIQRLILWFRWFFYSSSLFLNLEDFLATFCYGNSFVLGVIIYIIKNNDNNKYYNTNNINVLNVLYNVVYELIWIYYYVMIHAISNQCTPLGIKEDRINKPYRPIPSGKVSVKDARRLWVYCMITFTILSCLKTFLLFHSLMWCIIILLYNIILPTTWYVKQLFISFGTYVLITPLSNFVVDTIPHDCYMCIIYICIYLFFSIQVQDLRDIDGDKIANRSTCPTFYGDLLVRIICIVATIFDMIRLIYLSNYSTILTSLIIFIYSYYIYRLLYPIINSNKDRNILKNYDHKSYILYIIMMMIMNVSVGWTKVNISIN